LTFGRDKKKQISRKPNLVFEDKKSHMWKKFFVSKTGNDANDGLTWNTAKLTVANALLASASGDELLLGPGTYDEGQELVVDKGIKLRSFQGAAATTLTRGASASDYRVVSIVHPFACVQGFTISGGKTPDSEEGGNVFIDQDGCLLDCVVTGGSSWQYGGNVYIEQGTIKRCEVSHGAIRQGSGSGGGIYVRNTSTVDSCYAHHNTAPSGGGICIHQPTATPVVNAESVVRNCTMTQNVTTGWFGIHGSGLAIVYQGYATNCVSWGNTPNDAAFVFLSASVAAKQSYNDIGVEQVFNGSAPSGAGNISADPLLQPDGSLGAGSPCIAAGSNAQETLDIVRNTRVNVITPDTGAYAVVV
jgi:hypothetical protein